MKKLSAAFAAVLMAAAAQADTVYPAEGWTDRPDPCASPLARRGGSIRFNGAQYPKSFNNYVDPNSYTEMTFGLMYETLLTTDSVTSDYAPGLARRWTVSDDLRVFTFEIDPAAKWSDGEPVSAEDVIWTFDTIMDPANLAGSFSSLLIGFERPEALGAESVSPSGRKFHRTVRFRWKDKTPSWRALLNCGTFFILPRHAFENRKFIEIDMTGAVVSGPYRLAETEYQVQAVFKRRADWWREGTPGAAHLANFDTIVMRYYSGNENAFEALLKKKIDVYAAYSAHIFMNETLGRKFTRNWIAKRVVSNHKPSGFQGFAMNLRKPIFADVRVRRALAMLVDRETMNRTLMYGSYFLHKSYLEQLYDEAHPCTNRTYRFDPPAARKLLAEAGWTMNPETGVLEKDFPGAGKVPFRFTFLSREQSDGKFLALFAATLRECGIEMSVTRKDFAGWQRDMESFSFDMTWASWGPALFPCPRPMWDSREADSKSSINLCGFRNARVDELLKAEDREFDRARREDILREIDRILVDECPYILLWNTSSTRLLYWNKFGTPDAVLPKFGNETAIPVYWWADPGREEDLAEAEAGNLVLPRLRLDVVYDEVMRRASAGRNRTK